MYLTIRGFASLSPQEVFDKSLKHSRKKYQKSINRHGNCLYSGVGCAAAPFLTKAGRVTADKFIKIGRSGSDWQSIVDCAGYAPSTNDSLIADLQRIHDEEVPQHWEAAWEMLATIYDLKYTEVQ